MCIRIHERYAVCKCIYYVHGVDPCQSVGRHGHNIQEKTVLVGYACTRHATTTTTTTSSQFTSLRIGILPDSLSSSSAGGSFYR
ncbi:hypothetical protein FN846DRAFT_233031 [Sphaerosporella brunnea]|uniref:Uncharacterized protein n=1 Tax=Sphaerosporella brunnea TaxID=1250544 RepID=A0A5J5EM78_9PEZI|nr:hypothetical protein FN846DRAFT_233031 [Sphaerosporella brunnea]